MAGDIVLFLVEMVSTILAHFKTKATSAITPQGVNQVLRFAAQ